MIRRVAKVALGNFRDHKFYWDGTWKLRIDVAPGYRVYYAASGRDMMLLCDGDKRTQDADLA